MADNVTIPASGTGTATPVIATDDVSGVHYQYVKLVDGTADATGKIGGDATNGLDVDVTRLPSGTVAGAASLPSGSNNIGDVDVLSIAAGDNNIGNVDIVTMPNITVGTMANLTESLVDDSAFTPATSRVLPVAAEYDDTTPDSVDEGDAGALRMSANRNLYVRIRDNAGNERGANVDASGNLNVLAGSNSGVDIGDVTINNSTGASAVNIQDGGNSITVDGSVTATLAAGTNTNEVVGDAAHDAAIAGNPVRIGARAINAELTAVAHGDTADLVTDLVGKQITLPYANPENFLSGLTSDITGTGDTSVIAAQGAGVRIYVTQILVTNSHATVGTFVNIKDGSTSIYTGYAAAAGGGFSITLPVPLRLTANTALNAANVTTGSNTRVSASGYKGA